MHPPARSEEQAEMRISTPAALAAACLVCATSSSATRQTAGSGLLTPGVAVTVELASGRTSSHRIRLQAGEATDVTVAVRNFDAIVVVRDAGGRTSLETSLAVFTIVADASGFHTIAVRSKDPAARRASYDLETAAPRLATSVDRLRVAAQREASEGRALLNEASAAAVVAATDRFKSALARFREAHDRAGECQALAWLGDIFRRTPATYALAREHLQRSVAIARETGNRGCEARALVSLGATYRSAPERRTALDCFAQALATFEALGDEYWQAVVLTYTASVWAEGDTYPQAIDHYERALSLAQSVGARAQAGRILNSLGIAYLDLGDLAKSLDHHHQALALSRATRSVELEFMVIFNTGVVYKQLGDYRRALDSYRQSLALVRKLGNVYREGQVLNSIGNVYRAQGGAAKAIDYYTRALDIFRQLKIAGEESAALNNMGAALSLTADYAAALDHHLKSYAIRKSAGDRRGEASSLQRAGVAWQKLGDTDKALEALRESLEIRRAIHDPVGQAESLLGVALVERDRGDLGAARKALEAAIEITETVRSRVTDASLRAHYVARVQETYESYVDVLMRLHEAAPQAGFDAAALQAAERTRARVLLESLGEARADLREGVDARLLEQERVLEAKLDAASERLSRSLGGKSTEAEVARARDALDTLSRDYEQLQARIRASSPRYAALTQPQPLSVSEIQRDVLDEETVLLEFALGQERSWLWAVTPAEIVSMPLPPRREIEAAARSLYAALTARQAETREAAREYARRVAAGDRQVRDRAAIVSAMLLGGIATRLDGEWRNRRLVIVASGALEYLPFAALPAPSADRTAAVVPLIARHEIVKAPSASVLATLRREAAERAPATRVAAVLADPVFDPSDPRIEKRQGPARPVATAGSPARADATPQGDPVAFRTAEEIADIRHRAGLARLPFSRDEATTIARLAGSEATLLATDFQARRAAVLEASLADYRIVHFATHGLIDAERPELSGLVLSLVTDRGQPQDGLLRLHDIFNMRLNADLVVLSACQTALGKEIKGEGLVGLTRAFMYAGAPRVIASLWQVSDLATAELMKRFYDGLLRRGLPPSAALRTAQLELARDPRWKSPYFWAGFVIQGDWRALADR
ncbi:MAG: CHAT domain-containing tetratricopeptide repeat protein [Vicinamibacterales bacterium]